MDVDQAEALVAKAIDEDRAAQGYLVVGEIHGGAEELAMRILVRLFPDAAEQVKAKAHPDVFVLAPEGKKRVITVKSMREQALEPLAVTSFSGGWKACVVVGADRMESATANMFLKVLEEPPPKTMFLLLTDQPEAILPTILSRTQRIDLGRRQDLLALDDFDEVRAAFVKKDVPRLVEKFKSLKEAVDDADVALVRKTFFRTLLAFVTEPLHAGSQGPQAAGVPLYQTFRNVEAVEEAYRRSAKSIGDEAVLAALVDKVVFTISPPDMV